jgi:hypothetical protein
MTTGALDIIALIYLANYRNHPYCCHHQDKSAHEDKYPGIDGFGKHILAPIFIQLPFETFLGAIRSKIKQRGNAKP